MHYTSCKNKIKSEFRFNIIFVNICVLADGMINSVKNDFWYLQTGKLQYNDVVDVIC